MGGVNFLACRNFLVLLLAQKRSAFHGVRKRSDDETKRSDLVGTVVFVWATDHGSLSKVRRRCSSGPEFFEQLQGNSK